MIDPTRHEILTRLARLSELAPDLRFGQLVANLAFVAAGPWDQTLWNLEDDKLLEAIKAELEKFQGKWYLFYDDASLSGGQSHLRCVKVREISHAPDGAILRRVER